MTTEHEASRTLVKSPPELWAECSDAGSLARHLGEFGEIRITELEPESTVAWEGEHASGTVRIEPSGWGTRVTLTAQTRVEEADEVQEAEAPPPPEEAKDPLEGETGADVEPLSGEGESPVKGEGARAAEADDATVEQTLADADPGPVDDTGRPRARWRRIAARFRRRKPESDAAETGPSEALVSQAREAAGESAPSVEWEPIPEPRPISAAEPIPEPEPTRPAEPELVADPKPAAPAAEPVPAAEPELSAERVPAAEPEVDAGAILASALDSLGQAHHRPFSRA